MSHIAATVATELTTNKVAAFDPVAETIKRFPQVPTQSNNIVDAWGNPIRIGITRALGGFRMVLTSAGGGAFFDNSGELVTTNFVSDQAN